MGKDCVPELSDPLEVSIGGLSANFDEGNEIYVQCQ